MQRTQKRHGCGRYHSGAVTHMHSHAIEFQYVCSCLLWEDAGGRSLEAGTGGHPQQPPISLINQLKLRAKQQLCVTTSNSWQHGSLLAWGRQGILSQRSKQKNMPRARPLPSEGWWLMALCQMQGRHGKPHYVCSGPSCTALTTEGLFVSALRQGGVCRK